MAVVLFFDFSSLAAAAVVLRRLKMLCPLVARRLFVRQMKWLLAVDVLFHLAFIGPILLDVGPFVDLGVWGKLTKKDTPQGVIRVCQIVWGLVGPFRAASTAMEVHIAVVFALQALQYRNAVKFMSRHIAIWALVPAGWAIFVDLINPWDLWVPHSCAASQMFLKSLWLQFAGALCVLSYVVSSVVGCQAAPGSVRRRNLLRAAMYPLNYLISYSCVLILYNTKFVLLQNDLYMCLTAACESNSGLLNAVTYAWQTGHRYTANVGLSRGRIRVSDRAQNSINSAGAEKQVHFGDVERTVFRSTTAGAMAAAEREMEMLDELRQWEMDEANSFENSWNLEEAELGDVSLSMSASPSLPPA